MVGKSVEFSGGQTMLARVTFLSEIITWKRPRFRSVMSKKLPCPIDSAVRAPMYSFHTIESKVPIKRVELLTLRVSRSVTGMPDSGVKIKGMERELSMAASAEAVSGKVTTRLRAEWAE